ncbi:hypothetical protein SETIT_3G272100v2 [Setaria italica]|uniref:F-box domain-containing protein n=2 Tax=Setaria italica TaxID=4555 RepID=A0A368QJE5_SETIT|nr:uncharacterized protein LOC101785493 [Setaria italica]RCV18086.1 hypothetical protein SETIT_3G272100v2 [Setaria italica]
MLLKFQDLARCFIGSERAAASAIKTCAAPSLPAPATVSLPDNEDLLREILLRLPPLPSSLPRASLVCKRWRRLVSDAGFLRRFREHHRTPPLLGYFFNDHRGPVFTPTLAPPNSIPPARFSLPQQQPAGERLFFLGCRHGLALLINRRRLEAIVWDPVTNRQATVAYPSEFTTDNGAHCCRGAVLSGGGGGGGDGDALVPGGDDGHLMRPFKVILIRTEINHDHASVFIMCVYESGTGKWGNTISTTILSPFSNLPNVLIGNAVLCGFFQWSNGFLELDLDRQRLGVIETPVSLHSVDSSISRVVRTQDRGLGLAILSRFSIQMWGRKADSGGVVGWVLQKTIQVDKLLSLPPSMDSLPARILGYDEDSNAIHLSTSTGAFAIQLESMQFRELFNVYRIGSYYSCHPYASFYTAGWGIGEGDNRT